MTAPGVPEVSKKVRMSYGDDEPTGRAGAEGAAMGADASGGDATESGAGAGADDAATDAQRQLDEQRDKYLRLAAEYDNFRKRMVRERTEASARGQAELIRHIMDALDDLARFAHVDPDAAEAKTVVQGVEMVERKLLKALQNAGLTVVSPENSSFNPELHEAVATEPAASPEDDHVVSRVFQPGYVFNGQLLRPARVVVKQWNG
jgi:molecular chaperone GrpE